MSLFKADYTVSHFAVLTPEWLKDRQVKFIISSLTGTLVEEGQGNFDVFDRWYEKIERNGTGLIVASNESQAEVDRFIVRHKIVGFGNCRKPNTRLLEDTLFSRGLNPSTTLFIGNQWRTDIWCGKQLGIRTVKVDGLPPISGWGVE